MSPFQKDILLVILKSQLEIENAVLKSIKEFFGDGPSSGTTLKVVTLAKINEIKRQIGILETLEFKLSTSNLDLPINPELPTIS